MHNKKFAFTLAEILIVIAIIGAIFVMILANFIQKQQERITVTRLQKAYSVLNQAYLQAVEEYGVPSVWGVKDRNISGSKIIRDNLLSKMKTSIICSGNNNNIKKCSWSLPTKFYNGKNYTFFNDSLSIISFAQDNSGASFAFFAANQAYDTRDMSLSQIAWIYIDINGNNKPNIIGKDIFMFHLTDSGIIPFGYSYDIAEYPFEKSCIKGGVGFGCTAWVLKEKNMNYLHSDKCSWENTSCK